MSDTDDPQTGFTGARRGSTGFTSRDQHVSPNDVPEMGRREFFGLCAVRALQTAAGVAFVGMLSRPSYAATVLVCTPPSAGNTCSGTNTCTTASPNTCKANVCTGLNECLGAGANTCNNAGDWNNTCAGDGSHQNTCSAGGSSNKCENNSGVGEANTCGNGSSGSGTNTCENNLNANVCNNNGSGTANYCTAGFNQCFGGTNGFTNLCQFGASANTCSPNPTKNNRTIWYEPARPLPT